MILVVGGAFSGKEAFAERVLGFGPTERSADPEADAPVACAVQDAVRTHGDTELRALLTGKQVVLCDEVGSGIVPLDPDDRVWRERVGRLCCDLAEEADAVVRLVCGVPQVIKGEL